MLSRKLLNPILLVSSMAAMGTGLLLLFHIKGQYIVGLHEFSSLLFVVACVVHFLVNWRPLIASLKGQQGMARVTLALVLVLGLGILYANVFKEPRQERGRGIQQSVPMGQR